MKNKYRKRFIVSGDQLPFIVAILGLIIGVSAILTSTLYFIFQYYFSALSIPEIVVKQFTRVSLSVLVIVAVILFVICFFAISLMSNKIYGPLWRFGRDIKKMSDGGTIESFHVRKYDAIDGMTEVASMLAAYVKKVRYADRFNVLP